MFDASSVYFVRDEPPDYVITPDEDTHRAQTLYTASEFERAQWLFNRMQKCEAIGEASRRRFLKYLVEFSEKKLWTLYHFRSPARFLSARFNMGSGSAGDHVRIAAKLRELPELLEYYLAGHINYSALRAICRIADAENLAMLLDLAAQHTVGELEALVRQLRLSSRSMDTENSRSWQLFQARHLHYRTDHEGCRWLDARLCPDQSAFFGRVLDIASEVVRERAAALGGLDPEDQPTPGQMRADALMLMAEAFAENPAGGISADRFRTTVICDVGALDQESVTAESVSAESVTAESVTAESVTAESVTAETPRSGTHGTFHDCNPPPVQSCVQSGHRIAPETARRLSCTGAMISMLMRNGEPLAIGRQSPTVPTGMRRAVLQRDNHQCQFPGCTSRHNLALHHIHHWSKGGPTDTCNLVTLCHYHHRRLHEGGYTMRRLTEDERLMLRLERLRHLPDGLQPARGSPGPMFGFFDRDQRRLE